MEQRLNFKKLFEDYHTSISVEGSTSQGKSYPISKLGQYESTNCILNPKQQRLSDILEQLTQIKIEIDKKKQEKQSIKLSKKQLHILATSNLMEMANHYIFEIADRNEAYQANYSHFLILLYLTIKEITLLIFPSQHLVNIMKYIFQKLQKEQLRRQINQQTYYDFMTLIMRKEKISVPSIHSFMRRFLRQEREITCGVFPYYFNLFVFVVNKQIIFNDDNQAQLIDYTIDFKHQNRFRGNFTREDVFNQMRLIELLSIEKYHSEQL